MRRYPRFADNVAPELEDGAFSHRIRTAYDRIASSNDFVVVEGTGHCGVGSVLGCEHAHDCHQLCQFRSSPATQAFIPSYTSTQVTPLREQCTRGIYTRDRHRARCEWRCWVYFRRARSER